MKTINIQAKEWFDKVNGNSYFAGTVTLDEGLKSKEVFLMPVKYGYGNQYKHEATSILTEFNKISLPYFTSLNSFCENNNIEIESSIEQVSKRRKLEEVVSEYNKSIKRVSFWDSYDNELLKDIVTIKLNDLNR